MMNVPIYYSLDVEERRVSNNLKNLNKLLADYGLPKKPEYMLEEIAFLERELKYLKEKRRKRYSNKTSFHEMSFISS